MQEALVIIKPDAVRRSGVPAAIVSLMEQREIKIVEVKNTVMTLDDAQSLYNIHSTKDFFKGLVEFMVSGPCVVMRVQSDAGIKHIRDFVEEIRKSYATSTRENVVHASDSPEAAERELRLFFGAS